MIAEKVRKPTILLVEDNETIRNAFGLLLTECGYEVDQAGSGGEALEKAEASLPDLVLMDLGLPDASGLAITRKLKANPRTRSASIIAITGRAMPADEKACMDAGCAAYLAKPVETGVLLRVIEGIVNS